MSSSQRKICFTTLAMGAKYRQHALKLAKDIQTLTNNTPFVILTDSPSTFTTSSSLIPIKHQIQSVGIYHDKFDCIAESFRLGFDDCIFLDADCRLIENVVVSRNWKVGLTAKSCYDLKKHILKRSKSELNLPRLIENIAKRYDIEIEQCKFVNEWIFVVSKDGYEDRFLEAAREIRDILETERIFAGEGLTVGMAAKIARWSVHHYDTGYPEEVSRHQIIDVYKDKMFLEKDSIPDAFKEKIQNLNNQRQMIEQEPLFWRKINKFKNIISRETRYLKLRSRKSSANV